MHEYIETEAKYLNFENIMIIKDYGRNRPSSLDQSEEYVQILAKRRLPISQIEPL